MAFADKEDLVSLSLLKAEIKRLCGVETPAAKAHLVNSRIEGLMRELGCGTYNDLYIKIKFSGTEDLCHKLVECVVTHETYWFRDNYPFDLVSHSIVPGLLRERKDSRIRIWSSACSFGHEPYSLVISLMETGMSLESLERIEILATDISDDSLERAKSGKFRGLNARRGLSEQVLDTYFKENGEGIHIRDDIRSRVEFKRMNLLENDTMNGKFDIIFCRNVLYYFPDDVKKKVLDNLSRSLTSGGYLVTGNSERIELMTDQFTEISNEYGHCYQLGYG